MNLSGTNKNKIQIEIIDDISEESDDLTKIFEDDEDNEWGKQTYHQK